jgi:hypothetical protein
VEGCVGKYDNDGNGILKRIWAMDHFHGGGLGGWVRTGEFRTRPYRWIAEIVGCAWEPI